MDRISIFWNLPALKRKHHKCCHRLNTMQVVIPVPWKITPQKGWFPFTTQSGSYSTHFNKSSPISSTQHMTPTGHQHFGPVKGPGPVKGHFSPGRSKLVRSGAGGAGAPQCSDPTQSQSQAPRRQPGRLRPQQGERQQPTAATRSHGWWITEVFFGGFRWLVLAISLDIVKILLFILLYCECMHLFIHIYICIHLQ